MVRSADPTVACEIAINISGKFGYNALNDNSNTFLTRILREIGAGYELPGNALGAGIFRMDPVIDTVVPIDKSTEDRGFDYAPTTTFSF